MRCAACGNESQPGVRFCSSCGNRFPEIPDESSFESYAGPRDQTRGYAPPSQGYDQPQTHRYAPPPQQSYDYQQDQGYTRPQDQGYDRPQDQGYDQPQTRGYAPPPQQSYDYQQDQGYDRPQDQAAGVVKMLKALPLKKILMIGVPVVVLIIAAIIVIPMFVGNGTAIRKDNISIFYDGDRIYISGNNNAVFTVDGKYNSIQRSLDGSKAAILTDDRGSSGGVLWFSNTSGAYKVAEDVIAFTLADSGNGLVYMTEYDRRGEKATLYLYDTSGKKQTKITEDAMWSDYSGIQGVCISPNGKSVSYISDYDSGDEEFTGYLKLDGKAAERLGKNTFAVALSDGGRHLYYVKVTDDGMNAALYVKSGRNDTRLDSDLYGFPSLYLNADYSQVIFTSGDRSFISVGGAEKIRIAGSPILGFILPRGAQMGGNSDNATVYAVKNFAENVIRNSDGVAYLDGKYEINKISSSSDYASRGFISDDGKTLLFINNNGRLCAVDPTKQGADRRELGRDVSQFAASGDCKTIYYVNRDGELLCIKGITSAIKISEDVYPDYLALPYGSNRVFFLVDYSSRRSAGELFLSNNGGKRSKVPGGDDVSRVWVTATSAFYRTTDDMVFRSRGDEKFTKFAEDVN